MIDFHAPEDRKRANVLFHLGHGDFEALARHFADFERQTGVHLDPYGTTRLTTGHLALLSTCVGAAHGDLSAFLAKSAEDNQELIMEGD